MLTDLVGEDLREGAQLAAHPGVELRGPDLVWDPRWGRTSRAVAVGTRRRAFAAIPLSVGRLTVSALRALRLTATAALVTALRAVTPVGGSPGLTLGTVRTLPRLAPLERRVAGAGPVATTGPARSSGSLGTPFRSPPPVPASSTVRSSATATPPGATPPGGRLGRIGHG
ncbi:MAG: hypothetical protein ACRDPT_01975 [Streptomycetales bacterium]